MQEIAVVYKWRVSIHPSALTLAHLSKYYLLFNQLSKLPTDCLGLTALTERGKTGL